jgi:hypothetical protein
VWSDANEAAHRDDRKDKIMSWLKYVWASVVGFVVATIWVVSSTPLILWLTTDRVVKHSCARMPTPLNDCGGMSALGWGTFVIAGCTFVGLFIGIFTGTAVGISFYRKSQNQDRPGIAADSIWS